MPDHIFGYGDLVVHLAVVHLELETDEVGQDGSGAGLRPNRPDGLAGSWAHYRKTGFFFFLGG